MRFWRLLLWLSVLEFHSKPNILNKLETENIIEYLKAYKKICLDHPKGINMKRLKRLDLQHKPKGRQTIGKTRRRRKDQEYNGL